MPEDPQPGLTKEEVLARIFKSKHERRRALAALSFEEKFQIVLQLQSLSRQARAAMQATRDEQERKRADPDPK